MFLNSYIADTLSLLRLILQNASLESQSGLDASLKITDSHNSRDTEESISSYPSEGEQDTPLSDGDVEVRHRDSLNVSPNFELLAHNPVLRDLSESEAFLNIELLKADPCLSISESAEYLSSHYIRYLDEIQFAEDIT